jgi:hypothetical protein
MLPSKTQIPRLLGNLSGIRDNVQIFIIITLPNSALEIDRCFNLLYVLMDPLACSSMRLEARNSELMELLPNSLPNNTVSYPLLSFSLYVSVIRCRYRMGDLSSSLENNITNTHVHHAAYKS